jgi:ISXO2-like transposase domain
MTDTEKKSVSRHRLEVLIVDADFEWVNTALGNIKAAIVGTFGAVREKLVPRYLAEFACRFNRRYKLENIIPRRAFVR